ncbi:hypothetical protein C5S53_05325 [Methanophagales archaeon]|nr:hypothetical protein C5S53_05325 [Methanophagales archaeon]
MKRKFFNFIYQRRMGFYGKKGIIAIVDMGSVARSLEDFLEIQTRIDYVSIEHQFSGDVNDFCE